MEGPGSSPGMCPRWGHRTMQTESLPAVEGSGSWACGRGRGAGMETGAGGVGKAGSVESGRTGTVLAGCWVDIPGVPAPPSTSRRGVA